MKETFPSFVPTPFCAPPVYLRNKQLLDDVELDDLEDLDDQDPEKVDDLDDHFVGDLKLGHDVPE